MMTEQAMIMEWRLRLPPGYWFIPHVEDPEHMKQSEAQTAVDKLPLSESQDGYILQCDIHPKEIRIGQDYSIWPISIGPVQEWSFRSVVQT